MSINNNNNNDNNNNNKIIKCAFVGILQYTFAFKLWAG